MSVGWAYPRSKALSRLLQIEWIALATASANVSLPSAISRRRLRLQSNSRLLRGVLAQDDCYSKKPNTSTR